MGVPSARAPASNAGTSEAPEAWLAFVDSVRCATEQLSSERERTDAALKRTKARIAGMAEELRERCGTPAIPVGAPEELAGKVRDVVRALANAQAKILTDAQRVVEDFDHALENEDRFVVLVFGEVNAGKSGLANHIAGLEFGLDPGAAGIPFVQGREGPARLAESPVECTRDYQGFRHGGLLWIDCPGVLSATPENAELARRLVARADFIVFVTSSDAPFKRSEMDELARLIKADGAGRLEGCLVITKADRIEEDVDDEGELIRIVAPKAKADVGGQLKWAREQLDEAGLTKLVRLRDPHAISLYVARDALGLRWDSARPHRTRSAEWRTRYESSGFPALLTELAAVMRDDGAAIKALWPKKRLRALQASVQVRLEPGEKHLTELRTMVGRARKEIEAARGPAAERAGDLAASDVRGILESHGVKSVKRFDENAAERTIRQKLRSAVSKVVKEDILPKAKASADKIEGVVGEFIRSAGFEFDLKELTETRTYESGEKGGAYGSVGGGALGMAIGSFFGPLGTFLGGLVGSLAGRAIGRQVKEKRTVTVGKGTNADQVVSDTQRAVRRQATVLIGKVVAMLVSDVFDPLEASIQKLEDRVNGWKSGVGIGPRDRRTSSFWSKFLGFDVQRAVEAVAKARTTTSSHKRKPRRKPSRARKTRR